MLTHRHAHKGRHTYVGDQGQRSRELSGAELKGPTSAPIRLCEEPLLPADSRPSLSCWVTGQVWLFPAVTKWTQQFLPGPEEPEEQKGFLGFFFFSCDVHHHLLRGFRMRLLASSVFSSSDLSEAFSANFSFLSLWLALRRWRLRRR